MAAVLKLHAEYKIPLNLHISGTLLESIAWHCHEFLEELQQHIASGLVELVRELLRAEHHAFLFA